jgi:aryl-alcohol dehydrogenase-like predicted oxidoreductase
VTAWSPLSNGVLTGKYHGQAASEAGRMSNETMKEFVPDAPRTERVIAAVKRVSEQSDRSMAQVALAWLRSRSVIPILGARKLSQFQDNLASIDLSLSADQLQVLDDASSIELGFPYALYGKEFPRAILYGGMRDLIIA